MFTNSFLLTGKIHINFSSKEVLSSQFENNFLLQESLRCKVCNYPYEVASSSKLDWERGFTSQHWGYTAVTVSSLCLVLAGAWITIQLYDNSYIRMISASLALLVVYICIRYVYSS